MQTTPVMEQVIIGRPQSVRSKVAVNRPLAVMNGDKVTFRGAADATETEAQKLEWVNQKALALFSGKKTNADLIAAIKEQYPQVRVFDGNDPENAWVNQVCGTFGSQAFTHFPESYRYKKDPNAVPDFNAPIPNSPKMPQPFPIAMRLLGKLAGLNPFKGAQTQEGVFDDTYSTKILPQLYRENVPVALMISKGASRGTVVHEMYHALQYMEGLPFGSHPANYENDMIAKDFNFHYNRSRFGGGILDSAWQAVGRLWSWAVQVPIALLRKQLGFAKPSSDSAGEALRAEMRREQEVDKFIIGHRGKVGASIYDVANHTAHFALESKLKMLLSYRLD